MELTTDPAYTLYMDTLDVLRRDWRPWSNWENYLPILTRPCEMWPKLWIGSNGGADFPLWLLDMPSPMSLEYGRACTQWFCDAFHSFIAHTSGTTIIRKKHSQSKYRLTAEDRRFTSNMAPNMSMHSVIAVLILSTDTSPDSSRLFAKYYTPPHTSPTQPSVSQPYPTLKEQKAFEKGLLEKTAKQTSDVILYDNKVVVFKMESDVMIYVVGGPEENEILLYNVVLALRDTFSILLKYDLLERQPVVHDL